MKKVHCVILCGSQLEVTKSKGLAGELSWDDLIDNFEGFDTPAIKSAFDHALDSQMLVLLVYENLDGEMRHRGGLVQKTTNENEIKDIINQVASDLEIEFDLSEV